MAHKALIAGSSGPALTEKERTFFKDVSPCGYILFARNCEKPAQVRMLTDSVKECAGADILILVDQEGGRVQRMGPPEWRAYPSARAFAGFYESDVMTGLEYARAVAHLMALDLHRAGINTNCAPVLDIPVPGAHDIIGDRAYGEDPHSVSALARAFAEGLLAGGVLPVVKHMPGHGRARSDSHKDLPVIDASREELEQTDFQPFMALNDLPLAMTAHVVMTAYDETAPASVSAPIMEKVIRGKIGFDGLVMSDDLDMKALSGTLPQRASKVIGAGCDVVLHCSGKLDDMMAVAEVVPELSGTPLARFEAAVGRIKDPESLDEDRALEILQLIQNAANRA